MNIRLTITSIIIAAFFIAPSAHAAQSNVNLETLINSLLRQLESLQDELRGEKSTAQSKEMIQGAAPAHWYTPTDDGKRGKPKIVLTAPRQRASYDKDEDGSVPVSWEALNVPSNTVLNIELDTLRTSGSGVGGGKWQGEIPEGDSTGSYEWDIAGEGNAMPGVYRIRALVRECHSDGCDVNPDFPGQEEYVKTYAKTPWKTISITDMEHDGDQEALDTYKATLNGRTVDSAIQISEEEAENRCKVQYNDYDRHQFKYGDVLKCFWGGARFMTVDEWKG